MLDPKPHVKPPQPPKQFLRITGTLCLGLGFLLLASLLLRPDARAQVTDITITPPIYVMDKAVFGETFADTGLEQWPEPGGWRIITLSNQVSAITDSPEGNYQNARDPDRLITNSLVSQHFQLPTLLSPTLILEHRYMLARDGNSVDLARVEISTTTSPDWLELKHFSGGNDNGPNPNRTQTSVEWRDVALITSVLPLTPLVNYSGTVRLRFSLVADQDLTDRGWVINKLWLGDFADRLYQTHLPFTRLDPTATPSPTPTITPTPLVTPTPTPSPTPLATTCEEILTRKAVWQQEKPDGLLVTCNSVQFKVGSVALWLSTSDFVRAEAYSPLLPVEPNTRYTVTYWVRPNSTLQIDGARHYGKVAASEYSAAAMEDDAPTYNLLESGLDRVTSVSIPGNVWTFKQYSFRTEPDTRFIRLRALHGDPPDAGLSEPGRVRGQVSYDQIRLLISTPEPQVPATD